MDWQEVFLILYPLQGSLARAPAQTHRASRVDRERRSKPVPDSPADLPVPVSEDKRVSQNTRALERSLFLSWQLCKIKV